MDASVQLVPAAHPYPAAVSRPAPTGLRILDDPVIDPAHPERWWPHPALEPEFHARHDLAVLHVHFGFEHLGPRRTASLVRALKEHDVRLVFTIHDLDNPHLSDQTQFHRQLAMLIGAADHLITLSPAAAERVRSEHGREAEVLPHPPIAPADSHPAAQPGLRPDWSARTDRAGVFLKSVRANVVSDPGFYRALGAEIYLHHDVDFPGLVELATHVHEPMGDATLFEAVAHRRVVVLPYVRGTHSGWLQMCRDLGTSVAVPDCGCYASQAGDSAGVAVYRTGDGRDAARAVDKLLKSGPVPGPLIDAAAIRDRHHEIYRTLAADRRTP